MALFMDSDSAGGAWKDPGEDADLLAMKHMMEEPPEDTAELLKEQGNLSLKKGKKYYAEAIQYYTDAIECNGKNESNNAIYFSNRAHVNILLKNYGHAISDCKRAMEINPGNIKAYFRAAKASFCLQSYDSAKQYCQDGLSRDPQNSDLQNLLTQSQDMLDKRSRQIEIAAASLAKAKSLVEVIAARGIRLGHPLYKDHWRGRKPWLDSSGLLHWPVVFLYCQVMSCDVIEDFCETDLFVNHIQAMFGEDGPPLVWDDSHDYTPKSVELFYQTNSVSQLERRQILRTFAEGEAGLTAESLDALSDSVEDEEKVDWRDSGGKRWVKVDPKSNLAAIAQQSGNIIPGVPVFYVVARGTAFYKLFVSGKWSPP